MTGLDFIKKQLDYWRNKVKCIRKAQYEFYQRPKDANFEQDRTSLYEARKEAETMAGLWEGRLADAEDAAA